MTREPKYVWTDEDEARWQRFTKGIPNYGTDERNAGRLRPATASDVTALFKKFVTAAAPWIVTAAALVVIVLHF